MSGKLSNVEITGGTPEQLNAALMAQDALRAADGWRRIAIGPETVSADRRRAVVLTYARGEGQLPAYLLMVAAAAFVIGLVLATAPGVFAMTDARWEIGLPMAAAIALVGGSFVAGTIGWLRLPPGYARTAVGCVLGLALLLVLALGGLILIGSAIG